jgi:dienelactone hydrolase
VREVADGGLVRRDVRLHVRDRVIPGTLTSAAGSVPRAVVLAGHGFTLSRRSLYPATFQRNLTGRGFAVAALDAPGHGERQPDGGRDHARVERDWRAHWREFAATQIAEEHSALIDALAAADLAGLPLGYWGLSLGTQYGVGVLASEPRIEAAVLGLSTLPDPGPRIGAYAARVACTVFFILQEQDAIASPDRARALFDRIGAHEKLLRASPGGHTDVPRAVFEEAYDFLAARLGAGPAGPRG